MDCLFVCSRSMYSLKSILEYESNVHRSLVLHSWIDCLRPRYLIFTSGHFLGGAGPQTPGVRGEPPVKTFFWSITPYAQDRVAFSHLLSPVWLTAQMCCHSSSSNAQPYSDNFCRLRSDSVQFENAGEMPWFCPTHSTRSKTEPHVSEISLQMTIDQRFEQVLFIIYHYRFYHNTPL